MAVLILDTNILMADYWQKGANFRTLFTAAEKLGLRIAIPALVIDELRGNFRRDADAAAGVLQRATSEWSRYEETTPAPALDSEAASKRYDQWLEQRIASRDFTVLPYPPLDPQQLVRASYEAKKPFKPKGDGFKDFILALTLHAATKEHPTIYFVSHNLRDFADLQGNLHDDIKAYVAPDCKVMLYRDLPSFINQVIKPTLDELAQFEAKLEDNEIDGLDLTPEGLRSLIESEVDGASVAGYVQLPDIFDDPTVEMWDVSTLDHPFAVRRLDQNTVLVSITGKISAQLYGFMHNADYWTLQKKEQKIISISDPEWNEHTYCVSADAELSFMLEIVFDEHESEIAAHSFEFVEPDQE